MVKLRVVPLGWVTVPRRPEVAFWMFSVGEKRRWEGGWRRRRKRGEAGKGERERGGAHVLGDGVKNLSWVLSCAGIRPASERP